MAYGSTKSISDSILSAIDGESIQEEIDVYMKSAASGTTGDGLIAAATINKDTDAAVSAMRMKSLGARKSQATAQKAVTRDKLASVQRDWTALLMGVEEVDGPINATLRSDMMAKEASSAPQTADEEYLQTGVVPVDRTDVLTPDGSDNISGSGASIAEGRFDGATTDTTPATTSLMSRPTVDNVDAIEAYKTEAMEVQKLLRVTVDGDFGKQSMKKLNAFQKRAGLPVTDNFYDPATVESLKIVEATTQAMLDRIAVGEGATQEKLDKFQGVGTSAYDMVLGYGAYGKPSKPISKMTLAELEVYMKELIKNSKGDIKGKAAKGKGSSAVGKYQVVYKSLFGENGSAANPEKGRWADKLGLTEDTIYSPEVQEEIGRFILQEAGFDNWMKNEKSEKNMLRDVAGKWASIEGNDYEQHIATKKKDLEPFLIKLREILNLPVPLAPSRSLRPQARPNTEIASN